MYVTRSTATLNNVTIQGNSAQQVQDFASCLHVAQWKLCSAHLQAHRGDIRGHVAGLIQSWGSNVRMVSRT